MVADIEHILERERLEVQLPGGVIVGRDGLRITVDHDRLISLLLQTHHPVNAAVVKLNSLPYPVRSSAEDDDLLLPASSRFVLCFVGGVVIWRFRRKFSSARINRLEHREDIEPSPEIADRLLVVFQMCAS